MTFEDDLTKRRINVAAFAAGDPERYAAWRTLYEQVHPNTFYTAVKMIINDVRRQFWLEEVPKPATVTITATAKPVMRRATGTVPNTASAIPDEPSPSVDRTPELAPAPRGRAVIRRPPVTESAVPEEKEQPQEKPLPTESQVNTPEALKPGRARPVFKRPVAETPASSSAESESNNQPPTAPEESITAAEAAKPPRPRPVFRKPATPTQTPEAETKNEASSDGNAMSLPVHSNPDPDATPKPPRPRPVFKRPTPATVPDETEITTPMPETQVLADNLADNQVIVAEEKSDDVIPEATKPPWPRPIFKRPATATSGDINKEEVSSPAAIPENRPVDSATEKPIEITPEPVKPPRPRPIFKRPGAASPEQNAAEATPEPTAENNPELMPEPEKPKFPRPRPIIERPTTSTKSSETESLTEKVPDTLNTEQEINNLENKGQQQPVNESDSAAIIPAPESTEVPIVSKPPRPRPIFKRPAPSGPSTETPLGKPETE
ncbi:hypothetical protein [Adhaeribacter radiodurans]|uniref:Uncharacterized protein n=1 Tax=Adhaeribacter radiodurans TaxID=2745197 RepID=A0A7L7LD23_9BACT|nr:hypothetical protein [Adhaeribacter radiodurans]QMU30738.1 hypothetical protein HUW48_23115 [Adhaeribacter radiodurans]